MKLIKSIKYNIKKLVFFSILFSLIGASGVSAAWDLLDKAFQPSIEQNWLVDLGRTKDQVGNELLRESTNVSISLSWVSSSQRSPLIVRIAKLLLRITIVLAVTMVLYNWILYIIQSSKWETPKDPQKNLINIWLWILLSLASLWIINLINSITISSLKTSEDLWWITVWCQTGWAIIAWDDLKKWICEKSTFGHPQTTMQYRYWDQNRIWNRCWFANDASPWDKNSWNSHWDWKNIVQAEMESKCVEDMWGISIK